METADDMVSIARERARAIIRFVEQQSSLLDKEDGSAHLAAGKIFELLLDYTRAIEMYKFAQEKDSGLEPRARELITFAKGGVVRSILSDAEELTERFPQETFPNLVTDETFNAFTVLAQVRLRLGDADAARQALTEAASRGDAFAPGILAARFGREDEVDDSLPRFRSSRLGMPAPE